MEWGPPLKACQPRESITPPKYLVLFILPLMFFASVWTGLACSGLTVFTVACGDTLPTHYLNDKAHFRTRVTSGIRLYYPPAAVWRRPARSPLNDKYTDTTGSVEIRTRDTWTGAWCLNNWATEAASVSLVIRYFWITLK